MEVLSRVRSEDLRHGACQPAHYEHATHEESCPRVCHCRLSLIVAAPVVVCRWAWPLHVLDTLSMLDALNGYLENTSFDNAGIDIFTKGLWGIVVSFISMPFVIRTMRFFYKTPNFKGDANALARSLIIYGGGVLYSIIYISGVLTRVKTLFVRNGTSGLEEYGPFLLSISPYVVVTSCAVALLLLYRDRAARIPGQG